MQCATLAVPLDYADLAGPWIRLSVARHPASDPAERIGSLFINPGGPGASGIADLPVELDVLTPELIDRFDIVEWNPRGVGLSDPVRCFASNSGTSDDSADPVPSTPAQEDQLIAADREFAADCERGSGRLLDFVGTASSARDLDMLREAVGDARLTYLGHSYGTFLGAIYAELFPNLLLAAGRQPDGGPCRRGRALRFGRGLQRRPRRHVHHVTVAFPGGGSGRSPRR